MESVTAILEEKLQLLVDASATLLGSVHRETPAAVLALAMQLKQAEACAIWRLDPTRQAWHITASLGLSEDFARITVLRSIDSWSGEAPHCVENLEVAAIPSSRRQHYAAEGIRSLMALPMNIADRPGTLTLYFRQPQQFSATEMQLGAALANVAAAALQTSELLCEREQNRVMMEVTVRALREREDHLRMVMEAARMGIWDWDIAANRLSWSDNLEAIHGFSPGGFDGRFQTFLDIIHPDDRARFEEAMALSLQERAPFEQEFRIQFPDGSEHWIARVGKVICDRQGNPVHMVGLGIDITERRRLEQKLHQAEKIESIGLLAGGIAHDFNNLLTAIMGNASLVYDTVPGAGRDLLDNVMTASRQAADLTRQLLAYSGLGKFVVVPVSVSLLVREIADRTRTMLPQTARMALELSEGLPLVNADKTQIQQVIINLLMNAAEAIGDGVGHIGVRTGEFSADEQFVWEDLPQDELKPGRYVYLEVSDTGCGMGTDTQSRMFDPFFTTKFTGRGLGLAAVSGIVRGHGGMIRVTSELGKGSTFRVLLPAAVTVNLSTSAAANVAA